MNIFEEIIDAANAMSEAIELENSVNAHQFIEKNREARQESLKEYEKVKKLFYRKKSTPISREILERSGFNRIEDEETEEISYVFGDRLELSESDDLLWYEDILISTILDLEMVLELEGFSDISIELE